MSAWGTLVLLAACLSGGSGGDLVELARLEREVAEQPDDRTRRWHLGRMLFHLGRLEEADRQFAATDHPPVHAYVPLMRGMIAEARLDYGAAERFYRASLAVDPDYAIARDNLERLLQVRADLDRFAAADRRLRHDGWVAVVVGLALASALAFAVRRA